MAKLSLSAGTPASQFKALLPCLLTGTHLSLHLVCNFWIGCGRLYFRLAGNRCVLAGGMPVVCTEGGESWGTLHSLMGLAGTGIPTRSCTQACFRFRVFVIWKHPEGHKCLVMMHLLHTIPALPWLGDVSYPRLQYSQRKRSHHNITKPANRITPCSSSTSLCPTAPILPSHGAEASSASRHRPQP